ncbi:zinc finger CCCH domain-containing protein 19 [Cucumis melo var. makuwa]|uniref:Zinc finger CCCH domain-containing protein 19 n=1 Tax=Cucumis melo var. makuwa TaxID=1194695 RepID=A0A5A7SWX7_CUCMM|nr:zinc finger CCCH domain-containing protein 19 [Cucumis melo var. makuwa]
MEAEEDDSSYHDQKSSSLDVKCDTNREELHSNEQQHCASKSSIIETEFSPNTVVESLPPRDAILGDEILAVDTCSEMEKKDLVEEKEIKEEKDSRNIIQDMAEDSVKLEIEPDIEKTGLSEQRAFDDVKENTGVTEEEKALSEFAQGELLPEMVFVGVAENQAEGNVLMANFSEHTVVDGSAGCVETTETTCLSDVLAEETLAETTLFVQDVDVTDAINLVQKTKVEEHADDANDSKDTEVPKQENFSVEKMELGVRVQLEENSELKGSLVDGAVEGRTENLADRPGETLKRENASSTTNEVGLTHIAVEIKETVNVGNAEDKTIEMDGMCMEDKATAVGMMENLTDETPEIKGVDVADYSIEELKIEDMEDREAGVQGLGLADKSPVVEKLENVADESAEAEGVQVTDYTAEEVKSENVEDDKTAQGEEIAMAEEIAEPDDMVYLVDEGIGSEETDVNMTYLVEETEAAEEVEEMDVTEEMDEPNISSSGSKRKRGKNSKAPARVASRKKVEEDVCFICFDGGDLVLCDRRGCPKAYHPACINRDEAFFRAKGRWNCGWHLCSNCEKTAHYMCYTCTFSLCKGCIKNAVIFCVRGNKGFCETCMRFVTSIEKNEQGSTEKGQIDFNDKNSWEYLFKEYWIDLKGSLSLTFDELVHAKNPWKGSETLTSRPDSPGELCDGNVDGGSDLDVSENEESGSSKKRKAKKRSRSQAKEMSSPSMPAIADSQGLSADDNVEWASKELLEFVMHMKNGDRTVLSQFDVQALLLEYIKRNKLRDPRRKSQIICDSRLESLFGKPRVGHFEMLKLLESHFLIKEDAQINDLHGSVAETESSQLEADGTDGSGKIKKEKKRRTRKKDERGLQSNLDDYAAIDIHNINLIYLKRNLVEYLIEDEESFHDKVVGSFVRIRISGSAQKQDLYRLVQVVGTSKASEPYKVGKRMTDILLEILNLNKTEVVSIDIISNQEFTEGELQERAMSLQDARVKDWMETEIVRLSHLRDRASEKGRRKEYPFFHYFKLQLLKTPEERQRRIEEIPEIHADPNMDPIHISLSSASQYNYNLLHAETYTLSRSTSFGRRTREPVSPGKGGSHLNDSWSGTRNFSNTNRDMSRNLSGKGFSNQGDDAIGSGEIINETSWGHGRERDVKKTSKWDKQVSPSSEMTARNALSGAASESSAAHSVNPTVSSSVGTTQNAATANESEKIWHYQDPSGKVQGPFSMVQLRKWSNTGYFPTDLRIWRISDQQEDSLLLTDVLAGKISKDTPLTSNSLQVHPNSSPFVGRPQGGTLQSGVDGQNASSSNSHTNPTSYDQSSGGRWKSQNEVSPTGRPVSGSIKVPRYSGERWSSDHGNKNFTNLPSPTPSSGGTKEQPFQVAASFMEAKSLSGTGGGGLHGSSVMQGSENDPLRSHLGRNSSEKGMGSGPINALQNHQSQPVRQSPIIDDASLNPAADIRSISANLQSLVQSINSRNPPIEAHGRGSGSILKRETDTSEAWQNAQSHKVESNVSSSMPPAQTLHSRWGEMSPAQNAAVTSFSAGSSTSSFSSAGLSNFPSSDPWRSTAPISNNPQHIQCSTPPNLAWGMGAPEGQSTVPRPGSESQNQTWGPMPSGNPNMGWGPTAPPPNASAMMWGTTAQSSGPAATNPGWIAPGQGPAAGNNIQGWPAHSPMPPPVNATPGWVGSNVAPMPPMNMNPSWLVPSVNQNMWGNEHGKNGNRFSNQKDGGSHGGDPGNGDKSWGMQPSFGGGNSRSPYNRVQKLCKYHESGHCKKGGTCDYRHK